MICRVYVKVTFMIVFCIFSISVHHLTDCIITGQIIHHITVHYVYMAVLHDQLPFHLRSC